MNQTFFVFEILFSLYLLLNLGLIAEKFLMPSLMNISRRYNMSWDLTGILVALGNLVPELTTTVLSFLKHGVKMTEFGVACNVGTSVFIVTVVPAVAMLITATSTKASPCKSDKLTGGRSTETKLNSFDKQNEDDLSTASYGKNQEMEFAHSDDETEG